MTTPATTEASTASTMQAVVWTGYGDEKDVLTFSTSQPTPPAPTAHQVQIRVHAASINPVDVKQLHGNLKMVMSTSFPSVPGRDVSGVVVAVGSAVTRFKVGDAVMADNFPAGTYAELVNVADDQPSLKPDNISFAEAAVVPLAAQTAVSAFEKASLAAGEKVVVIGAAGGVGSLAVQIAKLLGASHVAAVTSAKNAEFVKGLGADTIVDYTSTKLGEALSKEYDVVFDCVGGKEQWEESQKIMNAKGRFVTIVGDDGSSKMTVGSVLSTGTSIIGRKLSGMFSSEHHAYYMHLLAAHHKYLDRIAEWLKEGRLKVHIDKTFEFSEQGAKDMYAYSASGRTVGKTVLEVIKEGETEAKKQPASISKTVTAEPSSSTSSISSDSETSTLSGKAAAAATAASTAASGAATAVAAEVKSAVAAVSAAVTNATSGSSTSADSSKATTEPSSSTSSSSSTSETSKIAATAGAAATAVATEVKEAVAAVSAAVTHATSGTAASDSTDTATATTSSTIAGTDTTLVEDPAAHSTVAAVSVVDGGTGGSVAGTVADLPTAPHTDVSTGSIE